MARKLLPLLLLLAVVGDSHPLDPPKDEDVEDPLDPRQDQALGRLRSILGMPSQVDKSVSRKNPPQFMMELYNTIADSSGIIRARNPYDAKVVRSFIERDSSMPGYYLFNISGLEANETVLEAELHLYRRRTPTRIMHPTILSLPYYLIRVYQVLEGNDLDEPDVHRLLTVHYVGAHESGWQVFNVKQAVLAWMTGTPNLGLLVTASTLSGDRVTVDFTRRTDYHHGKQPILVLFDDDDDDEYRYLTESETAADRMGDRSRKHERQKSDPEEAYSDYGESSGGSKFFRRQKRIEALWRTEERDEESPEDLSGNGAEIEEGTRRRPRETETSKRDREIASRKTSVPSLLKSIDIYERAVLREALDQRRKEEDRGTRVKIEGRAKRSLKRTSKRSASEGAVSNTTECARHELYVDFKEIGWSSFIIAPKGYYAYHCKGLCDFPLSQVQLPTNHATVQGIVHKMGLVEGVEMPCCVPTKLLGASILFYDDNENVVLKVYEDMIADRCGCR
ncbi:bone morphogenetic protein 7 [Orussus abietinus]|uniref:bone morphogenetic protein 7 n=1 Tax=Orussus abietinus TaxID=222816 RepID=UPI0006257CEA|nr:bone morphogenetic protein 7 [Orussus abietinus]